MDNSTEKSPLKEPDGDGDAGKDGEKQGGGDGNIKEIKAGAGLSSLLSEPKARFVILSIALALVLVVVVGLVIVVLIAYSKPEPEVVSYSFFFRPEILESSQSPSYNLLFSPSI